MRIRRTTVSSPAEAEPRYDAPEYVLALIAAILDEFETTYWNVHQADVDIAHGSYRPENPSTITLDAPGLIVRSYWWGDEDAPEAALPNLAFGEVEVRWYKHPGRDVTVNADLTPAEWVTWFDAVMSSIRSVEPQWW